MKTLAKVAADFMMLQSVVAESRSFKQYERREMLRRQGQHTRWASLPTPDEQHLRSFQGVVFGHLRAARVFDIAPSTFGALYHEADVFTENVLCGGSWEPPRTRNDQTQTPPPGYASWADWTKHYCRTLVEKGRDLPYPDKLPFDSVFFGYGGVGMSDVQKGWRGIGGPDAFSCELLGHLLTASGLVCEFVRATSQDGSSEVMVYPLRDPRTTVGGSADPKNWSFRMFAPGLPIEEFGDDDDGPWYAPYTLMPWVLTTLVHLVNSYRKFALQDTSLFYRTEYARRAKRVHGVNRAVPPPFYVLRLKDETVTESARQTVRRWSHPSHRFDVRGHERIKVARGPLPLDPRLRVKLEKRLYKIFTIETIDQETWALLGQRRLPAKRPDEWLAIRKCWVKDYQKGPDGAPYVPAVRTVPKRRSATQMIRLNNKRPDLGVFVVSEAQVTELNSNKPKKGKKK